MDLVLVNPGSRARIYQSLGNRLTAVENPVWAGLIATFVRAKGFSVEIVDAEADDLTPEHAAARVKALSPTLVAIVVYGHQPSASTQNMTAAGQVCTAIKQNNREQPLLLLGGHVAALAAGDVLVLQDDLHLLAVVLQDLDVERRRRGALVHRPPCPVHLASLEQFAQLDR